MMSCKEIESFIRANKRKCIIYMSIGATMAFLICSVLYLLSTIGLQPDSHTVHDAISNGVALPATNILSNTTNLTVNMIALLVTEYKREATKNLTLFQLDYKKEFTEYKREATKNLTLLQLEFTEYKRETTKNLTLLQLDYNKEFTEYKRGLTKNLTSMFSDNKKELTSLIKNLTNSMGALKLAHLETKSKIAKNLTYILLRNNNLTRYCEVSVGKLNMLVQINNNTIHKVLSQSLDYMEKHKNNLRQNITKILQIMEEKEANIVKKGILFDKKIDSALEGSQLFWGEKCPGSWKDIGGVYPVKVCNYTGTS